MILRFAVSRVPNDVSASIQSVSAAFPGAWNVISGAPKDSHDFAAISRLANLLGATFLNLTGQHIRGMDWQLTPLRMNIKNYEVIILDQVILEDKEIAVIREAMDLNAYFSEHGRFYCYPKGIRCLVQGLA